MSGSRSSTTARSRPSPPGSRERSGGPSRRRTRRPPPASSRSGAGALGMHERFRDRRRAVRDAGLRRSRRLAGSAAALVALAALALGLTYSPLFRVAEITVAGAEGGRAAEVLAAAGVAPDANLLFVDLAGTAARVRRLPWVADAAVTRVPPATLEVSVMVREPVVVVRLADSSWLVDAQGTLVGGGARDGLARVDVPDTVLPSVGQPVEDPLVRAALAYATGLPEAVLARVQRYEARAGQPLRAVVTVTTDGDGPGTMPVVLGAADDVAAKGEALELILDRLTADETLATEGFEIDVRAPENPVLTPLP